MSEATPVKAVQKFKLLAGGHVTGRGPTRKLYKPGDIIESEFDLTTLNSKNPAALKKFARLYDDGSTDFQGPVVIRKSPMDRQDGESEADYAARLVKMSEEIVAKANAAKAEDEKLDRLTIAELRKKAEEEEIDLGAAISKADILKVFRTSRG